MRIIKVQNDRGEYVDGDGNAYLLTVVENDDAKIATNQDIETADSLEAYLAANGLTERE